MAARSIWKGTIGFGMVVVPVKLYTSTEDKRVGLLHNLHSECKTPLKQPRMCPVCLGPDGNPGKPIGEGETVKGYELGKGQYIVVTDQELDAIALETAHNIQIEAFRPAAEFAEDPRWFAGKEAYYLTPDEAGAKAFSLLMGEMKESNMVGFSKIAVRDKEQLCIVRAFNGVLLLQTLHWADELKDYSELTVFIPASDQERAMAHALVNAMTKPIDLSKYKDEYRSALMQLVTAKVGGQVITAPVPKKASTNVVDAFAASLAAMGVKV